MKHSIRIRFTVIFISMTILILLLTWFANNWLLESYYLNEKVRVLEDVYSQIDGYVMQNNVFGEDGNVSGDYSEIKGLLRDFSEKYNTTIVIIDSVNNKAVLSSARDGEFMMQKVQQYILGQISPEQSESISEHENYSIQKNYDKKNNAYYLESWGFFSDNSTLFIMSIPLASLRESVDISNRFLAYVAIAVLLCGSIMMYFTGRKVARPIMELAKLSEKMSNLDFEAKYTGDAKDEVGILGNSMNTLSDRLKDTIGELKTANNELQQDIEKKQAIDEMRKEFIANVSHELKTPIALIQGYAEGLTEGMGEDPESRKYYCDVIADEADKMNQMVKQLLTLSAIESGNDVLSMDRFDMTELILGVLTSSRILIDQKKAIIRFDASTPVYVWADEFKIEEVITNYLSNALNHLDGDRNIVIHIEEKDGKVRVSFYNDGNLIPQEDLSKLWTKFYKVDKAHTRSYGGSGIGLSIVKAIMESHHEKYGVRNCEKGVEFWFEVDYKNN